ncbi:MAG: cytochrome c [Acidobacteria bacterium]|nr:MAG: cytochrome c [Acidobacteriota bacterium]
MAKFVLGVIIGIFIVPAAFYFYCRSGLAPVATAAPPMLLEKFFSRTALHAAIDRQAPKTKSTQASEGELVAGIDVYRHNCAGCHGLPGKPASNVAKGMFPRPPQLFESGHMVTDDPVGESYWKVKHGIRLTGMPGFTGLLTDEQIWTVSLLLANADKLPPSVEQALSAPPQILPPTKGQEKTATQPKQEHK